MIKYPGQKELTEERAYFICMFVCVCKFVCVRKGYKICKPFPNYVLHLASTGTHIRILYKHTESTLIDSLSQTQAHTHNL